MSFLDDIGDAALNVLKVAAPGLATALGGPLAGIAAKALVDNIAPGQSLADTGQVISTMTPDQLAQLRKIDNDFTLAMRNIEVQIEQIGAQDRNSARSREIAVKDKVPAVLAFVITSGFFGLLGFMVFRGIPEANQTLLNVMVGWLGGAWTQGVVAYYYGTNAGSARKTELLGTMKNAP